MNKIYIEILADTNWTNRILLRQTIFCICHGENSFQNNSHGKYNIWLCKKLVKAVNYGWDVSETVVKLRYATNVAKKRILCKKVLLHDSILEDLDSEKIVWIWI